jgi:hypothetical protein
MSRSASLFFTLAIAIGFGGPAYAGSIKFAAEAPQPPESLPVLRLAPQPAPVELIEQLLSQGPSPAKLAPLGESPLFQRNHLIAPEGVIGIVEDEHVRVWVDRQTGEAHLYPTLNKLNSLAPADVERQTSRAQELFSSPDFIARDDTHFVVAKPNVLHGATLTRDANGTVRQETPTASYLAFYAARRFVGELPVDGPGSRALLQIGGSGEVEGLTRVWKTAKTVEMVKPSLSPEQVRAAIIEQLLPSIENSEVTVTEIELAYYDANREFLQPVYRFTARIHQITMPQTPARANDNFVIGYVPFARAFEPLPVLGQHTGPEPSAAEPKPNPTLQQPGKEDPVVGRYVVRNDDPGWVNDANAFWDGLASTWTGGLFQNSQYYWAEPRLFTSQKDSFINVMNLALVEVHGNYWFFTTYQDWGDGVNINGDIPYPGYGPTANGLLADWVVHSCEVVPSPDDLPDGCTAASWTTPWWNLFGGVRNVVGYRTIMYIDDGAGGPYGTSLGNLAPVVSSWLSDVMSLNAYAGNPKDTAHCGINRPMGRPSTISMCGHDGDSVLSTSSLGRANCLTVWWFPD